MLPFQIRFLDGLPASDQLVQAVRRAILSGQLQDGDRFPSVRQLSQELKISPTTAHKAVAQLSAQGLLGSQPGVGMIIRSSDLPTTAERIALLQPLLAPLIKEAQALQLTPADLTKALLAAWRRSTS